MKACFTQIFKQLTLTSFPVSLTPWIFYATFIKTTLSRKKTIIHVCFSSQKSAFSLRVITSNDRHWESSKTFPFPAFWLAVSYRFLLCGVRIFTYRNKPFTSIYFIQMPNEMPRESSCSALIRSNNNSEMRYWKLFKVIFSISGVRKSVFCCLNK